MKTADLMGQRPQSQFRNLRPERRYSWKICEIQRGMYAILQFWLEFENRTEENIQARDGPGGGEENFNFGSCSVPS